jgi:hypothetical protein
MATLSEPSSYSRVAVRAATPDDAAGILRIVWENRLPKAWAWPPGLPGLVAIDRERVVAFAILKETIYGLVTEELWEEQSRAGFHGLTLLSRAIEDWAQSLADDRGEPLQCGGLVAIDRPSHIKALKRRGYRVEGVVLGKLFTPCR